MVKLWMQTFMGVLILTNTQMEQTTIAALNIEYNDCDCCREIV